VEQFTAVYLKAYKTFKIVKVLWWSYCQEETGAFLLSTV